MFKKLTQVFFVLLLSAQVHAQCIDTYASISEESCGAYISPSGLYTWEVSDTYMDTIPNIAGCDSILTVNLIVNPLPVVIFVADVLLLCAPGNVNFVSLSDIGEVYSWNFGDGNTDIEFTGATTNLYTEGSSLYDVSLKVTTDSGCMDSVFYADYISTYPLPMINLGTEDVETCDATYTLDATAEFDSYLWSTGETTSTIEVSTTGDFWVEVVDPFFGCSNRDTINVFFKDCSGIENNALEEVSLFPNPVSDILLVNGIPFGTEVSIFNIYGKQLSQQIVINDNFSIDMSQYADGAYYLRLDSAFETAIKRIIKTEY